MLNFLRRLFYTNRIELEWQQHPGSDEDTVAYVICFSHPPTVRDIKRLVCDNRFACCEVVAAFFLTDLNVVEVVGHKKLPREDV